MLVTGYVLLAFGEIALLLLSAIIGSGCKTSRAAATAAWLSRRMLSVDSITQAVEWLKTLVTNRRRIPKVEHTAICERSSAEGR